MTTLLVSLLLYCIIHGTNSFQLTKIYNGNKRISCLSCNLMQDKQKFSKIAQTVIGTIVTSVAILGTNFDQVEAKLPDPLTIGSIEQTLQRLEKSSDRSETLQNMADLYEIVQAKPAYMKAKYKTRVVEDLNQKRAELSKVWDQSLDFERSAIRKEIDPYRTVDLLPYFKVAPVVGGVAYIGALAVQQLAPEAFVLAYPAAAFIFLSPILFIILTK